ncbi:pyridoxamine 5'-phosphate oxidase family protein [Bacillus sp. SCS-153A]|uniref:pyridoxamine 5'-phosphate oxidase family protein n=1 Tax=Rossellomorea sedimentorum TaxID=3115294 RepID=UPI003906C3AC
MTQTDLKQEVLDVLDNSMVGTLATVVGNKPHSRYMTFFNDDLTLYTPTSSETHKADEIEQNPNVHVLLGYEGKGFGDTYVEVEGRVEISKDESLKKKLWNDEMERWFKGPDDPDLIILEIHPSQYRLMNNGEEPKILDL